MTTTRTDHTARWIAGSHCIARSMMLHVFNAGLVTARDYDESCPKFVIMRLGAQNSYGWPVVVIVSYDRLWATISTQQISSAPARERRKRPTQRRAIFAWSVLLWRAIWHSAQAAPSLHDQGFFGVRPSVGPFRVARGGAGFGSRGGCRCRRNKVIMLDPKELCWWCRQRWTVATFYCCSAAVSASQQGVPLVVVVR